MSLSNLSTEITDTIHNDIYKEIIGHRPRSWFGVNKYLHGIAEKSYYRQPDVIHNITHGRSLLYIIASNSLRGLSLALPLYRGVSTLDTYAHDKDGNKYNVKYNLLEFIMRPNLRYHSNMGRYEVDDVLDRFTDKPKSEQDKIRMYSVLLEKLPQDKIIVVDVMDFMWTFIDCWCGSLSPKHIITYMNLFLSCPAIKSIIANNVRRILDMAANHKYVFDSISKCEFITSEDKSNAIFGNLRTQGTLTAVKDLQLVEVLLLLNRFRNGTDVHANIIKTILVNHPSLDLVTTNKALNIPKNDLELRDRLWTLSMDVELAVILNTRFPIRNRLELYTGTSLKTATYLLNLDLQDNPKDIMDSLYTYLVRGRIIYKALMNNDTIKAELTSNLHKYMLKLLVAKKIKSKLIIALTQLVPKKQLDVSYLDIIYSSRAFSIFETLLPYFRKKISKTVFISQRGKHADYLKSKDVKIIPALTPDEAALFV